MGYVCPHCGNYMHYKYSACGGRWVCSCGHRSVLTATDNPDELEE